MKKNNITVFLALIFLGGWGNFFQISPANIYDSPRALPQQEMYHYTGSGEKTSLRDFKGKFVLAVFWSRYCAPCVRELEDINTFVKETSANGIKVLLVSPESEWHSLKEQKYFLQKYGAEKVDFYVDKRGNLSASLGIFKTPNTVIINRKGQEIGRIRGTRDWADEDFIEYIYKIKAQQNH